MSEARIAYIVSEAHMVLPFSLGAYVRCGMCTLDGPSVLIDGGLVLGASRPRLHNVPRHAWLVVYSQLDESVVVYSPMNIEYLRTWYGT